MQSACEWLEDAVSFLQQASLGVDVENYEECLRQQADIMSTEQEFLIHLEELQTLLPQLENLVNPTAKEQLRVSVESAKQRGVEVRDQLQCHQDVLHSGLEEQAAQLELVGSDASKATISRSMTTVWQRWTRLRSVARGQERVLEDTAQEWRTFREKLQSRFPDSAVEKASKATLQSLLDQHDLLSQDLERELSSLMLLRQYALSLLHDVEVPSPTADQDELPSLREIRVVQDQMESLLTQSRTKRAQAAQELREREEVEKELGVVKAWIQETRELLLNPTPDIDSLLQELEVLCKEREYQRTREIKEDFSSRIHAMSEKLKTISNKFKEKSPDVDHAKEEVKDLIQEIQIVQGEIDRLQAGFTEDIAADAVDSDLADHLAMQPAEETDEKHQFTECQNMLLEIEEKVLALTELSVRSENLLREGRTETRVEAEQLAARLRTLKGGLLELQRMLQDKQLNIQVSRLPL
ncbi:hypothetical protein XENOCAPTIV_024373 [Xenoophorus captivus]|uniref:SYNE1 n=1 Tax=Xenoophorus captivus TaxID=1517983 RepID=A0ABV0RDR9_9TELE